MKRKTWSVASISSLLVVIAIVVVINLIGLRIFGRADLTENNIYTLSKASRNTVAKLEDRLTAKAYFTENLPAPYNANSRYVRDALEDYRSYGKGNFAFEFVDPADEAKLEQEAQQYRIQPVQVNVMEKDNLQVKRAYMGIVLVYGDKHETLPFIQNIDNFEYEMTSAIKRLTAERLPRVGFLGGFETPDMGQDLRQVTGALSRHYEVVPVSTSQGNSLIDPNLDVLCVLQPEQPLDEWTKFCIDQYLMQGGKVGWFVNKVKADVQASQASPLNLNIDDLTRNYGFVIQNNLVTDAQAAAVNVQQQQGMMMMITQVQYPAFPRITDINRSLPMVKDLQELTLFFPSSIDTVPVTRGSVTFAPLFASSEYTKIQSGGRYDIQPPQGRPRREEFTGGKKLLGLGVVGTFASAFEGKPVPHPTDSAAGAPAVQVATLSPATRQVVIGDGNFVQGQFAQGGTGLILFMNAVDWMGQDDDLIAIRSREAAIRPLKPDISDATKQTVRYANWFGPPLLVLLVGMFRWTAKRNRRKGVAL